MTAMKRSLSAAILIMICVASCLSTTAVSAAQTITFTNEAAAAKALTRALRSRNTAITIHFEKIPSTEDKINSLLDDLYTQALAHNGTPVEGDYLLLNILDMTGNVSYSWDAGMNFTGDFIYNINYASNAQEEAAVDEAVNKVINSLSLNGRSEFDKARAIYDYICDNVTYDFSKSDSSRSAYAAIVKKSAVCQGYAALFYRMALAAGLDCRIITGRSNNENHGWNIVRIDGTYYNVDTTYGARAGKDNYFLKGSVNFTDHEPDKAYTSPAFTGNYVISATDYPLPVRFTDVPDNAYYKKSVDWAVENNITKGKDSATTFKPLDVCTRSEIVTFIYRAMGSPAVTAKPAFTDVNESQFFAVPVAFAVERNITSGRTPTTFVPNAPCTRAEAVTFLYCAAGRPGAGTDTPFKDVKDTDFCAKAVSWAYANNITKGVGDGTMFDMYGMCTRSQIVAMLYRAQLK